MYRPDLACITDMDFSDHLNVMAVGWLDPCSPFRTGTVPEATIDRLASWCRLPTNLTRGFHVCPFCKDDEVRGNGEIHVPGRANSGYVAPQMIFHYVDRHPYQPPEEFIEALFSASLPVEFPEQSDLAIAMLAAVESPSEETKARFYSKLISARVGARVPSAIAPVRPGPYVTGTTGATGELSIPTHRKLTGEPVLMVLADIRAMSGQEPFAAFFDIAATDVVKMAAQIGALISVAAMYPRRSYSVTIPPSDVAALLKNIS